MAGDRRTSQPQLEGELDCDRRASPVLNRCKVDLTSILLVRFRFCPIITRFRDLSFVRS